MNFNIYTLRMVTPRLLMGSIQAKQTCKESYSPIQQDWVPMLDKFNTKPPISEGFAEIPHKLQICCTIRYIMTRKWRRDYIFIFSIAVHYHSTNPLVINKQFFISINKMLKDLEGDQLGKYWQTK